MGKLDCREKEADYSISKIFCYEYHFKLVRLLIL